MGEKKPVRQPVDGAKVKDLRDRLDWTQGQLAYHSNVDQATISRIEANEFGDVKVSTVKRLAAALGVTVAELLNDPAPTTAHGNVGDLADDPRVLELVNMLGEATDDDRRVILGMAIPWLRERIAEKRQRRGKEEKRK